MTRTKHFLLAGAVVPALALGLTVAARADDSGAIRLGQPAEHSGASRRAQRGRPNPGERRRRPPAKRAAPAPAAPRPPVAQPAPAPAPHAPPPVAPRPPVAQPAPAPAPHAPPPAAPRP